MIGSIIKILDKLKDNIGKYNVIFYDTDNFLIGTKGRIEVVFVVKGVQHSMTFNIDNNKLTYYICKCGTQIETKVDDISKYEILKLFSIIKLECENYTSQQMRLFADSVEEDLDEID